MIGPRPAAVSAYRELHDLWRSNRLPVGRAKRLLRAATRAGAAAEILVASDLGDLIGRDLRRDCSIPAWSLLEAHEGAGPIAQS